MDGVPNMKIFMVSDVHLGALIREHREKYLVKTIEEHKPDLVLICGDLIDSDIAPVLKKISENTFKRSKPRWECMQ